MNLVSVITPSIRPEGLRLTAQSLQRQNFKKWEWIICGPEKNRDSVKEVINGIVPYEYLGNEPLKEGQFWDLNYSYNKLFRNCNGSIVVSLQDWIYIPSSGLETFLEALQQVGEAMVSGVGDQYERLNEFNKPQVKIWSDPRKNDNGLYECYSNDAEFNWVAFPKELAYKVGGFDEGLDFLGVGGDQLQFCERLDAIGTKFYLDQSNESFTLRHGREDFGGQKEWDSKHVLFNGKYDERRKELIKNGKWPVLDYLKH